MADNISIKCEIIVEADAESLEKLRKAGHARGFTVYCDEGERTGGSKRHLDKTRECGASEDEMSGAIVYAMRPAAAKVRDLAKEIIAW